MENRYRQGMVPQNMTWQLLSIILFLGLIGLGNIIGLYNAFSLPDRNVAIWTFWAVCLYWIPAWGLLRLKRWARKLELVISGLLILLVVPILLFIEGSLFGAIFVLMTHGLIMKYLLSLECKALFASLSLEKQSKRQ